MSTPDRKEPTFDGAAAAPVQPASLDFTTVGQVVETADDLAAENHAQHLAQIKAAWLEDEAQMRAADEAYSKQMQVAMDAANTDQWQAATVALIEAAERRAQAQQASAAFLNRQREVMTAPLFKDLGAAADARAATQQAKANVKKADTAFKQAVLQTLLGQEDKAAESFDTASAGVKEAADHLDAFADYVPSSKMFNKALAIVAKRDQVKTGFKNAFINADKAIAGMEDRAAEHAQSISSGFKSFAGRMRAFAKDIADTPARIKAFVKEKSMSVADATATATMGFISNAKDFFRKTGEKFSSAVDTALDAQEAFRAKVSAKVGAGLDIAGSTLLHVIDKGDEMYKRVSDSAFDTLQRTADSAEQHAKATASVVNAGVSVTGAALRSMRDKMAATYQGTQAEVAADQVQRRSSKMTA